MNKEEIIKLNLKSLCVYKGIFEEKVGDKFRKLVDKLCDNSKIEECVKAYNEFTFEFSILLSSIFSISFLFSS